MTIQLSGSNGIDANGIKNALSTFITGQVIFTAGASAPPSFLKCNGAAISRSVYSGLFAVIGTTYGVGNGSTTFNVPDLRGEFIRGLDDGRAVDAGRSLGSAQAEDYKSHRHTLGKDDGITPISGGGTNISSWNGLVMGSTNIVGNNLKTLLDGGTETRPRNIALLACIFSGV